MNTTTSNVSKLIRGPAFRPVLIWLVSLLGTAVLASILFVLEITPAWSATPEARSVTVSYRDLDLASREGANVLYRRIQAAAKEVCGRPGADLLEQSTWKSCYHNAISDAVGKVNNPLLTAVHTGHPAAVTAMLAK